MVTKILLPNIDSLSLMKFCGFILHFFIQILVKKINFFRDVLSLILELAAKKWNYFVENHALNSKNTDIQTCHPMKSILNLLSLISVQLFLEREYALFRQINSTVILIKWNSCRPRPPRHIFTSSVPRNFRTARLTGEKFH